MKQIFKLIKPNRAKKAAIAKKEYPVAGFCPFTHHWNDHTLITNKDELMQVIKVSGFSFETADDEDVDIRKSIRNQLFKGMSSGSFALYFHTIRRRQNVFEQSPEKPEGVFEDFRARLHRQWNAKHMSDQSFVNEHYITIVRRADTEGVAKLGYFFKRLQQTAQQSQWERDIKESYQELQEMSDRVITTLRDYNPQIVGVIDTEYGLHSQLLAFFGRLLNGGQCPRPLASPSNVAHYLGTTRAYFGNRSIEIKNQTKSRFAGIISIKEYGASTNAGLLDSFLQMPFEFIMTQSFTFANRQVAIAQMQLQQNRMIQAEDVAVSQIHEINQALDMAMSGDIAFGGHHLTVMCVEDNPRALENALSMVVVELDNAGMSSVREKLNMEPCYWAQLPGNFDFAVRRATINTLNLAGFASLHNFPTGQETNNHWGDAVTVLDTTSGTPFFFNFHVRDVGHTTIIGPTGAGKTVLMNFLCAEAQKFDCRLFFFDKDRGAEIFLRALGATYTVIDPGSPCHFNPLQLPNTGENRTFLLEWLKLLVTTNNEPLSAEDIAIISEAINGNYKLKPEDRNLANISAFLGIGGPGTISNRLQMWHSGGSHANVFDNPTDSLDLDNSNIFGFEMAELLKDPTSLGPVLLYVFHKINLSLDGTPTMIVLDEAWALIDNPIFAPKIKDWLKVLRKLNTFIVFATQSVEDASKSDISDTLIQQTATQIFLPNLKATSDYRTSFMLSEREFQLIKTTNPATRFFLIKQGTDAVVARIDLSGMTDIINVLSGRSETVLLLDQIRQEYGDDPKDWLDIFCERARSV